MGGALDRIAAFCSWHLSQGKEDGENFRQGAKKKPEAGSAGLKEKVIREYISYFLNRGACVNETGKEADNTIRTYIHIYLLYSAATCMQLTIDSVIQIWPRHAQYWMNCPLTVLSNLYLSAEEYKALNVAPFFVHRQIWFNGLTHTGCVSKNLTLYKNAHQTKPTIGKWSSLLILQQMLSHDQNKVKNWNILKWILMSFKPVFSKISLLLK